MAWETIPDERIRHIWAPDEAPDGEGEITVAPSWYAENGTPVDPESGDDMSYVRTEIEILETIDGEQSPATRVVEAVKIAVSYGGIDGAHHKDWVIDQMVRVLAGRNYDQIVTDACADGADWDEGIAP
jgi:hypothetical protein